MSEKAPVCKSCIAQPSGLYISYMDESSKTNAKVKCFRLGLDNVAVHASRVSSQLHSSHNLTPHHGLHHSP